jgi:peptidoglycan/LPS O-acetylase OafA/YrhL
MSGNTTSQSVAGASTVGSNPSVAPSKAPEPKARARLGSLDALRGIAALSVMLLHFTTDFHRDFKPSRISSFEWRYGAYGVHLFFLISGFVILMTAEKAASPYDFFVSRFTRLYPPYWAAILFTTILLIALPTVGAPEAPHLLRRALVDLTMFQGWATVGSVDTVYWTLQVEMSFYLVLLVLIWRRAVHNAVTVMTGLVLLALCDHLFVPRPWSTPYAYVRQIMFFEHAYLFTTGMVLYKMRDGFKPHYAVILLICALCPITATYWPNNPPVDASIAISLAFVVYLATSGRADWIASSPLLFLGGISYSLYLTHHWLGQVFLNRADKWGMNPNLALLVGIALCLLIATLMTYLIERPSLHWLRQRLSKKTDRSNV